MVPNFLRRTGGRNRLSALFERGLEVDRSESSGRKSCNQMLTKGWLARLWREESGQDFVEYMLLSAFLGLAVYGGFNVIQNAIHNAYISWDSAIQSDSATTPDPGSFGS